MTQTIKIYGFGSHFERRTTPSRDIDLLLIHADLSRESIDLAISVKALILGLIPSAHIAMLSDQEERELQMIARSGARLLQQARERGASEQIKWLAQSMGAYSLTTNGSSEL